VLLVAIPVFLSVADGSSSASGKTPVIHMNGRDITIPAPPGMLWYADSHAGFFQYFAPAEVFDRWEKQGGKGPMPYNAVAATLAHNERLAKDVLADRRGSRLGTLDAPVLAAWQQAMLAAKSGAAGPLPDAPEGFVRIERITAAPDLVIDVIHMRDSTGTRLMGDASVLVKGRALSLTVILRHPSDRLELARVRSEVVEWAKAFRAANR
jgi:hypothetical protein